MKEISTRIDAVVRPVVEDMGYDLILTELTSDRGHSVVRLYIDQLSENGGITIENCTQVSRQVSAVLDVEDPVPGNRYRLEVSSPGIDRPLVKAEHFKRFTGCCIRLRLKPGPGKKTYKGVIREASNEEITIEIENNKKVNFRLCDIDKANLMGDLEQHSAPAPSASRK